MLCFMKMKDQDVLMEKETCSILMQQKFNYELSKVRVNDAKSNLFLTEATYKKLINNVKRIKMITKKKPQDYRLVSRYDVMFAENKSKRIYLLKKESELYSITSRILELLHVLHETHLDITQKDVIEY